MKFQRSNLYTANKQDNRETSSSSEEYKTEVLSSTKSTKKWELGKHNMSKNSSKTRLKKRIVNKISTRGRGSRSESNQNQDKEHKKKKHRSIRNSEWSRSAPGMWS